MDTTPPNDPAPAPAEQAPSGLVELFEDTLAGPLGLGAIYARAATAPPPGYPTLVANVAVYSLAFLGINILRARLTFPEAASHYSPEHLAAAGILGLVLMLPLSFVWAGALHLLNGIAGGKNGFQRSYHVFSLLSLFWPMIAAANAFPLGWIAVIAFWTFLTAVAFENLQQAPADRARAVFGGSALVLVAVAWIVSLQVDRYLTPYVQTARLAAQMQRQAADLQAAQTQALEAAGVSTSTDAVSQSQELMLQAQKLGSAGSSLDLIAGPGNLPGPALTPERVSEINEKLRTQTEEAKQFQTRTLDSVMPMLDNPALTKGMSPEQAKQLKALGEMLRQMQDNLKTGKPLTPDQIAQMERFRQSSQQIMMQQMQKMQQTRQARGRQQGAQPAPVQQGSQP